MPDMIRTDTETIIKAMRQLAADIISEDGIPEAAINEAADRLTELHTELAALKAALPKTGDEKPEPVIVGRDYFVGSKILGEFERCTLVQDGLSYVYPESHLLSYKVGEITIGTIDPCQLYARHPETGELADKEGDR
jgi:hypothetical protein